MKKIIVLIALVGLTTALYAADAPAPQIPVAVTCKPQKGEDYIALANTCGDADKQDGCDRYKNTPGFGPATPTKCETFKKTEDLVAFLKKQKRFPGLGGNAVTCKTRAGKVQYAVIAGDCSDNSKAIACDTSLGIADAIACTQFVSDVELKAFLDANPKTSGIECKMKLGGIAYRAVVPECSDAVKNEICKPKDATVTSCKYLGKDAATLANFAKQNVNQAMVTCKLKATGSTYRRPAADCNDSTQRSACPPSAEPVHCEGYKTLEKLGESYKPKLFGGVS